MKKIALVLAVLLFTAPAMAALSVSCTATGGKTVTVAYNAGGGTLPRAFAVDISLSGGMTITGGPSNVNSEFYIYPGSIIITGGVVTNWGLPVATGGVGTGAMTIEMGSLYASGDTDHPSPPPNAANLFTFDVSGGTVVTVAENAARGGVVMEDGSANGLGSPVCTCQGTCIGSAHADYSDFVACGYPASWCNQRQCHGDANAQEDGDPKNGYFWVQSADLNILLGGWKQDGTALGDYVPGSAWIAGDFNRREDGDPKNGYFRVQSADLNVLLTYWKQDGTGLGPDPAVPADCN